jgi:hypothetical protein
MNEGGASRLGKKVQSVPSLGFRFVLCHKVNTVNIEGLQAIKTRPNLSFLVFRNRFEFLGDRVKSIPSLPCFQLN